MMLPKLWSFASVAALFGPSLAQAPSCSSTDIAHPSIPGGRVLSVSANPVSNYKYEAASLSFCNVTVTYTHPGKHDDIHVTVWLPSSSHWSGRLQGSGGGGYAMRHDDSYLAEAVAGNYSVVATDGGHSLAGFSSASWSLDSSNNVNMALLEDFAYVALKDAADVGKQVTHSFYGHGPRYSYWNGCSTGGRQGLMLAQRYPTAYHGIVAAAPAINWPSFIVAEYWPQFVMNQLQHYPPKCVTDAITNATIKACDAIDGVVDNVLAAPEQCKFDPKKLVNTHVNCSGIATKISQEDVLVVQKTWDGMRSANGSFQWYGLNKGAPLSEGMESLVHTTCTSPSKNCTGAPFPIPSDWIRRFILQDPSADLTKLSHAQLDRIFAASIERYNAIIGTDNPDLSAFNNAGGKMITWQGLADQVIFPKGTEQYYGQVEAMFPSVRDFYRFFEVPGVQHCRNGNGPFPDDPLAQVVEWVENGKAPETLAATSEAGYKRGLCPYPLVAVYKGGDAKKAESYECGKGY